MTKVILYLISAIVISIFQGCAGNFGKMSRGDFGGVIKDFNVKNKGDYSKLDHLNHFALCQAQLEVKRYNQFFQCFENLERRIQKEGFKAFSISWTAEESVSSTHHIKGRAYLDLGEYDKAIEVGNQIVKSSTNHSLYQQKVSHLPEGYHILAIANIRKGNRSKAKNYAQLMEETIPQITDISPLYKINYFNLASVYFALNDYSKTLESLDNADSDMAGVLTTILSFGITAVTTAIITDGDSISNDFTYMKLPRAYMFAKSHLETGNISKAKELYNVLYSNPRTHNFGEIYWGLLYDMAKIDLLDGKKDDAIKKLTDSIDIIELHRSIIHTESSKIGFVGDKQAVYTLLVDTLLSNGDIGTAFEYAERGKARALVDILANKKKFGTNSNTMTELEDISKSEVSLVTSSSLKQRSIDRALLLKKYKQLSSENVEVASLTSVTSSSIKDIQSLLPDGETLIEYYGDTNNLYVFALSSKGITGTKLNVSNLHKKIVNLRTSLQEPNNSSYANYGKEIYNAVLAPLEKHIVGKNITIVPHGSLHYLPFNALTTSDGMVIDKFNLRILPSASVMKFLGKKIQRDKEILILGNPNLNNPKMDLPGAQNEAIAISKKVANSSLLLREQATETAIKNYGNGYKYIHLASHGFFDPAKPLSSGLLLSKDELNDGVLTVNELYETKLDVDLITLSACETGLGKIENGDDVVGFTRGFLFAGANSIVSSLWKVDDEATNILMQNFYDKLESKNKRESLRDAQMYVKEKYSHPYYWAAFQLTGSL